MFNRGVSFFRRFVLVVFQTCAGRLRVQHNRGSGKRKVLICQ